MLALAEDKKTALMKNDVTHLESIIAKEWALLKVIKQLETERESLIGRIAALCHLPKETLRIEHIIDVLKAGMQDEFIHLREELAGVLSRLSETNLVNRGLVDTHLAYSAFCVNLLSGQSHSPLSTYSHSGAVNARQENGNMLIDQMA